MLLKNVMKSRKLKGKNDKEVGYKNIVSGVARPCVP